MKKQISIALAVLFCVAGSGDAFGQQTFKSKNPLCPAPAAPAPVKSSGKRRNPPPPPEPEALTVTVDPSHDMAQTGQPVRKRVTVKGPVKTLESMDVFGENALTENGTPNFSPEIKAPRKGNTFTKYITLRPTPEGGPGKATVTVKTKNGETATTTTTVDWKVPPPPKSLPRCINGQPTPDGGCICAPDQTRKVDPVTNDVTCVDPPKPSCFGGEMQSDGTCKCANKDEIAKPDGKGNFVCVAEVKQPHDGAPGESRVSLLTELKLGIYGSQTAPKFNSGGNAYLAVGPSYFVNKNVDLYMLVGFGTPGTAVTDREGRRIPGTTNRNVSGVVEGGAKIWLHDYVGIRAGVIYLPFGLSNALRYTRAGLGANVGVDFRVPINRHATFIPGVAFMAGGDFKESRNPGFGYGGFANLGFAFWNQSRK